MSASLITAKYGWLEISDIRKGFVNFQARLLEICPICDIKHEKDQLYGFLLSSGSFMLRCYQQKQYKPDHKGLIFGKATKFFTKPKQGIVERISNAISNPHSFVRLSETIINVKKLRDSPEVYSDFLSTEKTITLIHSPSGT